MNDKINIGEVTVAEFNLIMRQLSVGQLSECIDLFMRLRQIGAEFQAVQLAAVQTQPTTPE